MKRLLLALGLLFCAANAGAQTTTFNGVVKDLTNAPVPTGQVTFQLKPGIDTTISGSSRFVPATTFCEIHNPGVVSTSGTGTITVVVDTAQNWLAGDSLIFVGTGDATLNASTVASPYVITVRNSSTSFVFTQSGAHTNGAGGTVGGLYKSGGTGACAVMQNSALLPQNTSYTVSIQAIFSPSSSFNTYAIGSGPVDISTVVPTPSQMPAYSFVDLFSTQTITGNKTTSGAWAFSGPATFTGVINLTGAGSAAVQTALNSLVAGQVYIIPCGTYVGPASAPSNTGLISLGPVESTFFTGAILGPTNVVNCVTFTYSTDFTLPSGTQNVRLEGITLDFGNTAHGLVLSTANFNRFNSVNVVRCQLAACVTLTNSGANTFNHLRVNPTGATGNTGILLNGVPSVTTINKFYDTMIAGNILYCIDTEKNADTNYFYDTSCNQALVSPAATAAWLAFNLNTPGSDQGTHGNYFVGFNYTGATPISNVRSGQSSGNVIDWSLGGPAVVTVTGGTPQFSGRVIGLGGSAFPSYNYNNIGGVTYDLGMKRVYTGQNATALTTGAFAFGGNWGAGPSPSFTSVTGSDGAFILSLSSGGGAPGANPTVTLTFANGTWTQIPVCVPVKQDANAPTTAFWVQSNSTTATALVLAFVGTPAASTAYSVGVICNGKPN